MIGVEPLHAGISSFHVTFSSVVHLTGRFFSPLTPLSAGPRHWGQFSAVTMLSEAMVERAIMTSTSANRRRMSFLRLIGVCEISENYRRCRMADQYQAICFKTGFNITPLRKDFFRPIA